MIEKILSFFRKLIPGFVYRMGQPIYHLFMAWSGSVFYRHPSRDIFVIGVTGTKGKSTTVELLSTILEEGGENTALLSTVRQKIRNKSLDKKTGNTMAGRWHIQRFLRKAVKAGCNYAIVEVTSEGVAMHRHRFIDWDAAFFLNLSPEHIESHGSFEKYRKAKVSFFKYLKHSKKPLKYFVVNADDPNVSHFKDAAEHIPYSRIIEFKKDDVYKLVEEVKQKSSADWLMADFNLENVSAAAEFAKILEVEEGDVKKALIKFPGVPGRMEFVRHEPFGVVIDYAHTPDSMRALYKVLREHYVKPDKRLISVFGATGGGRDKWKRPKMGEVAENYCDVVFLTSDDTYDEDPLEIMADIKKGISGDVEIHEEPNRVKAIERAVKLAEPGDVVALVGVGSQTYMNIGGKRIEWSERQTVERLLNGLKP